MGRPAKVLGAIVRADDSGLGNQTRNITRLLSPGKLLLINSHTFNQARQHPEWYEGHDYILSDGFTTYSTSKRFLQNLTHVITAETFYGHHMVGEANRIGIKTFQQYNHEFLEHHKTPNLPMPYKLLCPSYWYLEEMQAKYSNVDYLPPPIFTEDYEAARFMNFTRKAGDGKRRLLHIMGKEASHDRNGTRDLLECLQYTTEDFELVIKSQYPIDISINDPRVKFQIGNTPEQQDLYTDFDALVMPRRYGGLCLPMNEALCSGLPVIMTNISPNNRVLPKQWLVSASKKTEFMARTTIDVYESNLGELASKLDWLATMSDDSLFRLKLTAYDIGESEYSSTNLLPKYKELLEL